MVDLGRARQILAGMNYLTEHDIIHRDLALRNVLVSKDVEGKYIVKVGDFGMSKRAFQDDKSRQAKPVKWSAPEVMNTSC